MSTDIEARGQGFDSTEVEFSAKTEKGKEALQTMGGGFACIGMTVRKSALGTFLDCFSNLGCTVHWVG